ncbi:universal stress protein [Mucilaginibacter sp. CSA2-8R]|uniref:universal stress protein n=1 Tax=Mucilaginibacter sp. CSA2-8R TaxID=3141542 RepID=UPI00315CE47D
MKAILQDILIPIDLSDTSFNALNTAINMARRHQARLHLLYVSDIMFYYPKVGDLTAVQLMAAEVMEKDAYLLEKLTASIKAAHRVDCRLYTVTGNRNLMIKEWVQQNPVDLTILGLSPSATDASYLFDSLPYQLLQATNSHVLTVPADKSVDRFQHIIYPVQSTGTPMSKFPLTRQIAEKNNADVSVISLIERADADISSSLNRFSARVKFRLDGMARSVTTGQHYTHDRAASLASICRTEVADLVVIEADTQRNIKEYFFGNFTQKMLRNPDAAVLCINPSQRAGNTTSLLTDRVGKRRLQVAY